MKQLLAALLTTILLVGCNNGTYEKAMEQGELALANGEFDKALASFELALKEEPKDKEAKALYERLIALNQVKEAMESAKWDDALAKANSVLKDKTLESSIKKELEKYVKTAEESKVQYKAVSEKVEYIKRLVNEKKYSEAQTAIAQLKQDATLKSAFAGFSSEVGTIEQIVNTEIMRQKDAEVAAAKQALKQEENPQVKIQGSPMKQQLASLYTVEMNSVEGENYTFHVFSTNEQHETQQDTWAGANAGDEIYRGTYQIALQSKGSVLYVQEAKIGEFEFNRSQKRGVVSEGSPDFFVAVQREASNADTGKVFYINKGKVMEVKIDGSSFGVGMTQASFKTLENGEFMTASYSNADGIWFFGTYQTDLNTGNAKLIHTKEMVLEEGNEYLQKNFN